MSCYCTNIKSEIFDYAKKGSVCMICKATTADIKCLNCPGTTCFNCILEWLKNTPSCPNCKILTELPSLPIEACNLAASEGHLDCLKYARDNGAPCNEYTASNTAKYGHFYILKYLIEVKCPMNKWTCESAAANGKLDCLILAHVHEVPWDSWTLTTTALNNQFNCFKYAIDKECRRGKDLPIILISHGRLEFIKYLQELKLLPLEGVCKEAAKHGQLEFLQYFRSLDAPWNEKVCKIAAKRGRLEILKYAIENGCDWDKWDCLELVTKGRYTLCVRYIANYI